MSGFDDKEGLSGIDIYATIVCAIVPLVGLLVVAIGDLNTPPEQVWGGIWMLPVALVLMSPWFIRDRAQRRRKRGGGE